MLSPTAALTRFSLDRANINRPAAPSITRYGFCTAQINCLLTPSARAQIVDSPPLCQLPKLPQWCAGIMHLHGNMLPVFDLTKLLTPFGASHRRHVIVFGQGHQAAGVFVDTLPAAVAAVSDFSSVCEPPPMPLAAFSDEQFRFRDAVWCEMDFARLFAALARRF